MILGLDASTTTAGYCFYDAENKSIIEANLIDIKKFDTNKEKCLHILARLKDHPHIKSVTKINLEAALSGFAGGFSSQQVIIKLSRFNALLEYILDTNLNIPVCLCNVNTMRKKVFGKCRIKGMKSKDFVKWQLGLMINLSVYDIKNTKGNIDARMNDVYDAIVCAMF